MSFEYVQEIPRPKEILASIPLPADLAEVKAQRDREIAAVFTGKDSRLVLVIGPCSAHEEDAVCDYISRLAKLQARVKDRILLVPRIYTNKPRTTGIGYKGMAHQPNLNQEPNIVEGIKAIRNMHIRALRESHLPAADEMLYPGNYPYLADVLSYVAVGARSVENQQHRLTASGLDVPVGMKNPTSGDMDVMFNSVQAAQASHVFSYNGWEVKTAGNPLAHAVLRGAVDQHGLAVSNYHYEDLMTFAAAYEKRGLPNPAIIVDTNHANSNKKYAEQPRIAREVMYSRKLSPLLRSLVKGFMIESYIEEGTQKVSDAVYGKSITDPCLGWPASEKLVMDLAEMG
ncbi:MAG: 3-deoxy-7-phosphoheptulonate synthase [Nitrospirae bacterium GWD2_57_8]|jgi:3-deoxy-7-phosphoheptulonate synthase|nr:MAG: 3-deoxy-7-phosphoheptulonate synthase [Nitrospirae bacterium GWD2_57_8]HAR44821.1 3-deoxy-7-phosphoheptulonate synthase [Nitrospiraceae bacterium]